MEFIASESGQSLQLVVMDEIRPLRGGPFLPDLAAEIVRRYRFVGIPTITAETSQPLKYQTGVWHDGDMTIPIQSLDIYNDGIIITSRNTEDADIVMDDFTQWVGQSYKLRHPVTEIPRRYQSRIIVSLPGLLDQFVPRFRLMADAVARAVGAEPDQEFHIVRFAIGPNPPGALPYQNIWSIEPRTNQPFVRDRFYSSAPLSTPAHIELINAIESAVG